MASLRTLLRQLSGQGDDPEPAEPAGGGEAAGGAAGDAREHDAAGVGEDHDLEQVLTEHADAILEILYPEYALWSPYFLYQPQHLRDHCEAGRLRPGVPKTYRLDDDSIEEHKSSARAFKAAMDGLTKATVSDTVPDWVSTAIACSVKHYSEQATVPFWMEFCDRVTQLAADHEDYREKLIRMYEHSPIIQEMVHYRFPPGTSL